MSEPRLGVEDYDEHLFHVEPEVIDVGDHVVAQLPWGDEVGTVVEIYTDAEGAHYVLVEITPERSFDMLRARVRRA